MSNCENSSGRGGEQGQIPILVAFGLLAFILLIAFVYNTAARTSRKVEMQGAADAAAVSSGVWMARGMNIMALNNNTMAEMLSIMVSVRAIVQTKQIQKNVLFWLSKAYFIPVVPEIAAVELVVVEATLPFWERIDSLLSDSGGVGWKVLTGLDALNTSLKNLYPAVVLAQAVNYARLNGADQLPYGWLVPGKTKTVGGLPLFPVARGERVLLVDRVEACPLKIFGKLWWVSFGLTVNGPITAFLSGLYFDLRVKRNIDSLRGRGAPFYDQYFTGLGDLVKHIIERSGVDLGGVLGFLGDIASFVGNLALPVRLYFVKPPLKRSLQWQGDPRPMVLTERPEAEFAFNRRPNLAAVHEYLQLLALALGKHVKASPLGGERYPNPGLLPLEFTYAQADVYNPTSWDMFTQDWRAKLVRARLLDAKCAELRKLSGLPLCGRQGWSFVNTH